MKFHSQLFGVLCVVLCSLLVQSPSAIAQVSNAADRFTFVQDGPLSKQLHVPLYEWLPKNGQPVGMILAIHGMTLHGSLYEVLARAFAAEGFYFCAPDMRGYGRCYTDKDNVFEVDGESKQKVNNEKSAADIEALARAMKQKYPDVPLYVMGESLGTTFCIKLAADHPELVSGILLSGPTAKVNPIMIFHPATMASGAWAVFVHPKFRMSTSSFVKNMISNDPDVINEIASDPLCRKGLTIAEVLRTQGFVRQTLSLAAKLKPELPILILQGSEDKCMLPHAVTKLQGKIPSSDQTLRWLHSHGHLLFETSYLRPATIEALDQWVREHSPAHTQQITDFKKELLQLGGKEEKD